MINRTICIYSGRFQPFGKHHAAVFLWAIKQFGKENCFIATSNTTDKEKSPFTFDEKKVLISMFGFNKIEKIKNPYVASEITSKFDPETTAVVFVIGSKDEDRLSKQYFSEYPKSEKDILPFSQHGYYMYAPTINSGGKAASASNIRNILRTSTVSVTEKIKAFKEFFGWYDEKLFKFIVHRLSPEISEVVFSKNWWETVLHESKLVEQTNPQIIRNESITEGGAAGHMAHPYEIPEVKTGDDLIDFYRRLPKKLNNPTVKIDGINASLRCVKLDNKYQLVMDRGSNNVLDVIGITKSTLKKRFKPGHGLILIGNTILDFMNSKLDLIKPELIKLGAWENPNVLFNIEYVINTTNIIKYTTGTMLVFHNLKEVVRVSDTKREVRDFKYNEGTLETLCKKLNDSSHKIKVYHKFIATLIKDPDYYKALSIPLQFKLDNKQAKKSLEGWLRNISDVSKLNLTKANYQNIIVNKQPITKRTDLDGALIVYGNALLGAELLKVMNSKDLGSLKNQEGIVINDKNISKIPTKITGLFALRFKESPFEISEMILEGGKVFSGETRRILSAEVGPTVTWLGKLLKIDLSKDILGTAGKKPDSGDIDLCIDKSKYSKEDIKKKLSDWCIKEKLDPKNYIATTGDLVHFKCPVTGSLKLGYVQIDFMLGEPEWIRWSFAAAPSYSKYKASHSKILLSSIAKFKKLKYSSSLGLIDRSTEKVVSKDPTVIAKRLLGNEAKAKDLESVESIVRFIKNDPNYIKMTKEAADTLKSLYGLELPD